MWILVFILFMHWVADFLCQSRWMADNKSKSYVPLLVHCLVYTLVLSMGLGWLMPIPVLLPFLALNFGLHMATDAVTSRITRYFWERNWIHPFFAMIGFDQFLHVTSLIVTTHWFAGGWRLF